VTPRNGLELNPYEIIYGRPFQTYIKGIFSSYNMKIGAGGVAQVVKALT
jgi:hypothetical protein